MLRFKVDIVKKSQIWLFCERIEGICVCFWNCPKMQLILRLARLHFWLLFLHFIHIDVFISSSPVALTKPVTFFCFCLDISNFSQTKFPFFHVFNLRDHAQLFELSLHIWAFTDSCSEHAIFFSRNETACLTTLPQITNSVFILSFPPHLFYSHTVLFPACSKNLRKKTKNPLTQKNKSKLFELNWLTELWNCGTLPLGRDWRHITSVRT